MTRSVMIFLPDLGGGGAERNMVNLARGLAEAGIAVEIVLASARGPFLAEAREVAAVHDLGVTRTAAALPRLVRHLRLRRPDVLLATLNHANVIAILAARLASVGTRVFVREANTPSVSLGGAGLRRARVLPFAMAAAYRMAHGVMAPSVGVARDLERVLRLPDVQVIPNPVVVGPLLEESHAICEHAFFDGSVPVVLGVGRLRPQKDFGTLIAAFALLRGQRPARLVILGEGSERGALEAQVRALGLGEDIDMPGFVDDPYRYMAAADLFVLSSRWEGLPNVLIQAMACGCPVVATDCPSGPREVLEDGRWGPLVPMQDPKALAHAMSSSLDSSHDRASLRRSSDRYRADAIAARFLAWFGASPSARRAAVPL